MAGAVDRERVVAAGLRGWLQMLINGRRLSPAQRRIARFLVEFPEQAVFLSAEERGQRSKPAVGDPLRRRARLHGLPARSAASSPSVRMNHIRERSEVANVLGRTNRMPCRPASIASAQLVLARTLTG